MPAVLSIALLFLLSLIGCNGSPLPAPEAQTISARVQANQVDLLAMGDWGTGGDEQRQVAFALANYVRSAKGPFHGMLLAGDNLYVELAGVDDPQWQTLFEQMYDPKVLTFPFFVALGNHDYDGDKYLIELAYAKKNPQSRWKLPSKWYRIDFPEKNPLVTVFMLDSNMELMPRPHWQAQTKWLREQLSAPNLGQWVICCAHHPLFSNGDHGDNGTLQKAWGQFFEEHKVEFYLCGHDHDLQHLQIDGWQTSFILCGGGGAGVRPMRGDRRGPFSRSLHGFVHLSFTDQTATVKFLDRDNKLVHEFSRSTEGAVNVANTTGRQPAEPRTVKSITRPDPESATAPAR